MVDWKPEGKAVDGWAAWRVARKTPVVTTAMARIGMGITDSPPTMTDSSMTSSGSKVQKTDTR
jgi:hypothetical protein